MKFLIALLATFMVAQILKVLIGFIRKKSWAWEVVLLPGGMPSVHSATVAAVVMGIFLEQGASVLFYSLGVFALIIMYDAVTLRRQVGIHTGLLNRLPAKFKVKHEHEVMLSDEHVGHTPIEVAVGVALGIIVPWVIYVI